MSKIDLKDAYFSVPLHLESLKCPKFRWKDSLYQFLFLSFRLDLALRAFTKLMKILISLLKKLNIHLILLGILIMASSTNQLTLVRDNLIYLWQGLGFLNNIEKSILQTNEKIELLGMEIDSVEITLKLPQGKKTRL